MALKYWAYIFVSPGFDKSRNTIETQSQNCRVKLIGIELTNKEAVIAIAKDLVSEGIQLIELCGAFGPIWAGKVTEAIAGAVPVGTVMYGPEARRPLLDILS